MLKSKTMRTPDEARIIIAVSILQLLPLIIVAVGEDTKNLLSPWLRTVIINPRATGCWNRPWICNEGKFPPRIKKLCCRNQCVDVTSDVYNCGLCGIRCPFTWKCCGGICINTNRNPFHCGQCDHKCPLGSFCAYGMCGYAQPLPPFPFPPKPPKPPFPFPPKPPKPPFPFPPKPPKPFPPHPPKAPPAMATS